IEVAVMEPVVTELSTVRDELVTVEKSSTFMPVVSPVSPAPSKSAEVSDPKSHTEREPDAAPKNSRHRIPSGVRHYRRPINQPRIVGRHVHHLRIGRFDDDCVSLRGHTFLFCAIEMSRLLSLLTHLLDAIGDILWLVDIGLAQ